MRTTEALELLARNSEPVTKPHPLDDMSNEEIAIILVKRGKVKTKRHCAEILGLHERTVQKWQHFGVAMDAFKREKKLGRITKGFNDGEGNIDGFS